ncbi:MAG: hypothetical protein AAFX93_19255 [Verrucomicrobiota bacterium]
MSPPDDWDLVFTLNTLDGGAVVLNDNIPGFYSASNGTVSFGFQWFLTNDGQAIDPAFISSSDPFANNFNGTYKEAFAPIVADEPFLWAYWLDADFDTVITPGDYLGWAEFVYTSGDLTVLQSVADTSGQGIFAGTTTVVPESKFYAILAGSLVAIFSIIRRRRSRIQYI